MATLQKRKGKNNWEICYPLPMKLREVLRTPALNRSLGTPDKAEAKRRFPLRLVEVEAEVVSLMAKHCPDDDTALLELGELIDAFRQAEDQSDGPSDFSEKDHLLDLMREWGTRQRSRRLKAYRGTPGFERQKALADDIKAKADDMVDEAVDRRLRISDLVDKWRTDVKPNLSEATKEEYERAITRFLTWCKGKRYVAFEEITRRDVREFVSDTYQGKMGKTVNLALGGLGGVWKHAHTIGWVDEKPTVWKDHGYQNNVRVGTGEKKTAEDENLPFSYDDIKALLSGLEPQGFADIIRLGLIAGGGRSSELSALRPENVTKEEDGYWVHLPGTKTKSAPRRVPVSSRFDPFFERLLANAGTYLVPLYAAREWPSERARNNYINKELNRKRRDLKLPNGKRQGVHSTRYTYIEHLEGADVSLSTAKLLVGHKRTDMTFGRYSSGGLVDLRESVEKMAYPDDTVARINEAG